MSSGSVVVVVVVASVVVVVVVVAVVVVVVASVVVVVVGSGGQAAGAPRVRTSFAAEPPANVRYVIRLPDAVAKSVQWRKVSPPFRTV